jgi:hypothetical protein
MMKKVLAWLMGAPSLVWVFFFPMLFLGLIGGSILLFWALANLAGFASLIFVVTGWFLARGLHSNHSPTERLPSLMVGGMICFYALMGMAIDQPGNYLFNKPIEYLLCPQNTTLSRGVNISHPLPERTDITQDFRCEDSSSGATISRPDLLTIIGIRFVEYVVLIYFFMAIQQLYKKLRHPQPIKM